VTTPEPTRADYVLTHDAPRITPEMLDHPVTVADAAEPPGIPARTLTDWIGKGHLAASDGRPRKVTLRDVYAASAAAHEADTRAENLRQNRR
jgi:hypothetical protein